MTDHKIINKTVIGSLNNIGIETYNPSCTNFTRNIIEVVIQRIEGKFIKYKIKRKINKDTTSDRWK